MRHLSKGDKKRANKTERDAIRQQLSRLPGGGMSPHAAERAGLISRLMALFRTEKH